MFHSFIRGNLRHLRSGFRSFRTFEQKIVVKILFLVFHGFSETSGISKKIFNQVEGLRCSGHEVSVASYTIAPDNHRVRLVDDRVIEDYGKGKWAPVLKRMCYGKLARYAIDHHFDLVYIRSFHNANPFTVRLVGKLKKHGIRVVMEIPTYPYDREYDGFPLFHRTELLVDRLFRKKLAGKLDAIVTFADEKMIFGQKTIRISNGIDFSRIAVKQTTNDTTAAIHLIGVAEVHYWHAFDRMIRGIGEYYRHPGGPDIYFHIVGGVAPSEMEGSPHAPGFAGLIREYGIEKQIIFHGPRYGAELDELFDRCDLAVGSLGRHRTGIDKIKTLKNREYAARGIPFVYSETDSDFDPMPYILKIPADETPVDVEKMIRFFRKNPWNPAGIRATVRELSWQKQMEKVVQAVGNGPS